MPRRDPVILYQHMLDHAQEAVGLVQGKTRADLDTDRLLNLALVRLLEIIGEAANQISEETRDALPHLPWMDMLNMRHRLVHAYYDINLNIVWVTIQDDLPSLIKALEEIPDLK